MLEMPGVVRGGSDEGTQQMFGCHVPGADGGVAATWTGAEYMRTAAAVLYCVPSTQRTGLSRQDTTYIAMASHDNLVSRFLTTFFLWDFLNDNLVSHQAVIQILAVYAFSAL